MTRNRRKRLPQIDWFLILALFLLASVGLSVLASAGFNDELGYSPSMHKQAASLGISAVGFLVCAFLGGRVWRQLAIPIYLLGCLLLTLVLTNGVVAGGARRWIDLGFYRLQPSEIMKIGIILAMAKLLTHEKSPRDGYSLKTLVFPGILLAIPAGLTVVEPDLGTALCQLMIGGSMILLAGVRRKTLLFFTLVGLVLAPVAWEFGLHDYQRQRVLTFLEPEQDPLGSGYHAMQSKIAVGSGALTGKGFREGTQTQLRFLPEQTTDFIFSVLAEEWGFFGTATILLLYAIVVVRLLSTASQVADPFTAFVAFGVATMIFWHVLINIGMVTGVLPVVGITLVMLSYGGSSLLSVFAAVGIVVGLSARRYKFT